MAVSIIIDLLHFVAWYRSALFLYFFFFFLLFSCARDGVREMTKVLPLPGRPVFQLWPLLLRREILPRMFWHGDSVCMLGLGKKRVLWGWQCCHSLEGSMCRKNGVTAAIKIILLSVITFSFFFMAFIATFFKYRNMLQGFWLPTCNRWGMDTWYY